MSIREEPWPQGTPNWVDLSASDPQAMQQFYRSVFGWDIVDTGEEMGHYAMCMLDGRPAAAIAPAQPGNEQPPAWTTYLASDDVDKTCDAIAAAGGTVMLAPMQVGEEGRVAVAADPTGAVFGLWQAGNNIGAQIVNQPGAVVWNECRSRDTARARDFYAAVFGYTYTSMGEGFDYTTIDGAGPGNVIGGIGAMEEGIPADVPAHWMTYFQVADADAAVEKVSQGGGEVLKAPFDTPAGRMAVLADPQGALFSIMQDTTGLVPVEG